MRNRKCTMAFLFTFSIFLTFPAFSQTDSLTPLYILPSIVPAAVLGMALYTNYRDFWKNSDKVSFHISNDPPYSLHNDKFGHAYYTALTADMTKLAYIEAGMERKKAAWIG